METSISVPEAMLRRVDAAASSLGISRSDFFAQAAERWLDELDTTATINSVITSLPTDHAFTDAAASALVQDNRDCQGAARRHPQGLAVRASATRGPGPAPSGAATPFTWRMQHMAFLQPSPASIRGLLNDLDAVGLGVGVDGISILNDFSCAAEPLLELLRSVRGPSLTTDSLTLATCHMLARGTTDLLAGVHLISHLYLPQAYTVLRPVYEAIDLLELFAKDPQQADLWVSTDKTFREFAPSAVRKKLGNARSNGVHDHLTELGTHPRLPGARLSGAITADPDQSDSNLYLAVGPFAPSPGEIVAAYVNALAALGSLSTGARHLDVATASVDLPAWLAKHIDVIRGITHALQTLETQLLAGGTVLSTQYADYLASLEQMRESTAPSAASTAQET